MNESEPWEVGFSQFHQSSDTDRPSNNRIRAFVKVGANTPCPGTKSKTKEKKKKDL